MHLSYLECPSGHDIILKLCLRGKRKKKENRTARNRNEVWMERSKKIR